jgi:5-methylcytosine-specific restriction endonuclease McrA
MPRDMAFIDFDALMTQSPSVAPLRDREFRLWVTSISWSVVHSTQFWISRKDRIELGGTKRDERSLCDAGLWLADEGGCWLVASPLWRIRRAWRERVPGWVRDVVLDRDGHQCLSCGSDEDLQMDHVYPWSRGGETTVENLQTLCGPCNRHKGASV